MAKSKVQYSPGKLPKLWDLLVHIHRSNPEAFSDAGLLRTTVAQTWTSMKDHTKCPNCKAGMKMYRRSVDYFIVMLVVWMGRIVKKRISDGVSFTEANKIHVNKEDDIPHNARNMTGIASALGLIAPVKDLEYHWAITARGWAALRGDEIQKSVITFRDEIIERSTEMTTFRAAAHKQNRSTGEYQENEWVDVAGFAEGSLFG